MVRTGKSYNMVKRIVEYAKTHENKRILVVCLNSTDAVRNLRESIFQLQTPDCEWDRTNQSVRLNSNIIFFKEYLRVDSSLLNSNFDYVELDHRVVELIRHLQIIRDAYKIPDIYD